MMRHTVVATGAVFVPAGCLPDRSDLDSGSGPFEQFTLFASAMASTGRASDASENSKAEGLVGFASGTLCWLSRYADSSCSGEQASAREAQVSLLELGELDLSSARVPFNEVCSRVRL